MMLVITFLIINSNSFTSVNTNNPIQDSGNELLNKNYEVGGQVDSFSLSYKNNQAGHSNIDYAYFYKYDYIWLIFDEVLITKKYYNFFSYEIDIIVERYQFEQLTEENLLKAINDLQIQHPEWVLRQSKLETGNFSSRLCTKCNNLFGMKVPQQRYTYSISKTYNNFAVFDHWIYSVIDYKVWQGNKQINGNYGDYLHKRNYASDKKYHNKLKSVEISL